MTNSYGFNAKCFFNKYTFIYGRFNPRRAGSVYPPPPNSAPEPGNIVTRGKRHLNERQQALRNCCGHFLGQVKGQNTRA